MYKEVTIRTRKRGKKPNKLKSNTLKHIRYLH